METARYWPFEWFDEREFGSFADVERYARTAVGRRQLAERVETHQNELQAPIDGDGSILAGTGMDISGTLACYHPDCRIRDADHLIRKTWHYFDSVVVPDSLTQGLLPHIEHLDHLSPESMLEDLSVLWHLKEVGAEELLEFRLRPPPRWEDWETAAESVGLDFMVQRVGGEFTRFLASHANIRRAKDEPEMWLLDHPSVGHMKVQKIPSAALDAMSSEEINRAVAFNTVHMVFGHVLSDVEAAQTYQVSLAAPTDLYGQLLAPSTEGVTPADVAFELDLPHLAKVPVADLLRTRRDSPESFRDFKQALRRAARERLRATPAEASAVAREVEQDIIEPEIRRMTKQVSATASRLRKLAVEVGVGTFVTTLGLLSGNGVVASAGLVAFADAVQQARSTDDVRDSDMFFIWDAGHHSGASH